MRRVWALSAALAATVSALGQVTSLVTIPIADTKGAGEAEYGQFVTGYERDVDPHYYHSAYLLVGIADRVEIAGATDFLGTDSWGFKIKALDDPKGRFALSAGLQYVRGGDSSPFVVGRCNCGSVRLHAGWQRNDESEFVCGLDYGLSESLSVAADFTSSRLGAAWGGLFWAVPGIDGLTLNVLVGVPNERDDGFQHSVGLVYAFRF